MGRIPRQTRLYAGVAVSALMLALQTASPAHAQASDAQLRAMQAQIDQLTAMVKQLQTQQSQSSANAQAAKKQASEAEAHAAQAKAVATQTKTEVANLPVKATDKDSWFFRHKEGDPLTFETPGGEITGYGNIDVSFDAASKNVKSLTLASVPGAAPPSGPVGNFGWLPDISTNLSYFGVRGFQRIPSADSLQFVYQFEAGFEVSATPGLKQSNSQLSNQVNGALFSRNTFIGVASPGWGAIKIGKSDAPYKNSTAMFNPFSGQWGDYSVIMGNTGGDNRVEFGTRVDHAVWYESPTVGGFQWNVMLAPGQNRSYLSNNLGAGESDCAGNNDPTSGGDNPPLCNDGSFSDLVSANVSYKSGGFYATAAYEWHHAVNRQSDITSIYGLGIAFPSVNPPVFLNAIDQQQYNQDVADEDAAKVGALYFFKETGTTVGAIVEHMTRYVPGNLAFENERSRWGTWAFLSQQITPNDSVHLGWAHAFHTPGDPGQHNDGTLLTPDGNGTFATNHNQSDMVTAAYKHMMGKNLTWYTSVAATFNGPNAHYDLGAGGRGVTTDCHDANDASGGALSTPRCFTGTTLVGVSTGLQWKF